MFDYWPDDEHEYCGVLFGKPDMRAGRVRTPPKSYMIVELPNRHDKPSESFSIHQQDLTNAMFLRDKTNADIIGFWHTHPTPFDKRPSQSDWDSVALGEKHWWHAIYHPATDTITWFDYYDNKVEVDDGNNHVRPRRSTRVARVRGPSKLG